MKTPLLLAALTVACVAAAQTKPAQKPAAQKPTQRTQPLLGTAQLPGDNGKIGQAYTMGEGNKLNVVLTGVRYTKVRWNHGEASVAPDRTQKLMVLSFQIQNPNKEITTFNGGSLKFTAIDQENENHEGVGVALEKKGTKDLSVELKPAQRIDCETVVVVPAKGQVPKLMVAHRTGGSVLRYDLHDVVKGLDKPFSENGTDALSEIKGEAGAFYPLTLSDVSYASTAFQERQLGNNTCDPAKEIFMLAKMTFKMQAATERGFMRFEGEAVDEDGDRYPCTSIRKAGSEDHMGSYAEGGQETNGRMAFVVPKGVKIAKVRVWETTSGKSIAVEYPVDAYATADGQPLGKAKAPAAASMGVQAEEYATVFRKADGSTAMEVAHVERKEGAAKTTEITVAGKRALLLEEADATTLVLDGETLRAPKATDKEPVTSLSYYAMAYANNAAPKPKKKNPFGNLGKALLDGGAEGLGGSIMSSGNMSNLGKVAVGKVVETAAQRTLTNELGRAVMTSTETLGGGQASASVAVDKKVYAETTFKDTKTVDPSALKVDASSAKSVDAKELYKRFAEFMGQGLK